MGWQIIIRKNKDEEERNKEKEERSFTLDGDDYGTLKEPAILDENLKEHYEEQVQSVINDGDVMDMLGELEGLVGEISNVFYDVKERIWNHDDNPIGKELNGVEIDEYHDIVQPITELLEEIDERFGTITPHW